jgi:hypothetical protein
MGSDANDETLSTARDAEHLAGPEREEELADVKVLDETPGRSYRLLARRWE